VSDTIFCFPSNYICCYFVAAVMHSLFALVYLIWYFRLSFFRLIFVQYWINVMVLEGMCEKKSFGIFVCKPQLLWFCCQGFLGSCMGCLLQRYTTLWQSSLKTTWLVLTDSIAAIGASLSLRNTLVASGLESII